MGCRTYQETLKLMIFNSSTEPRTTVLSCHWDFTKSQHYNEAVFTSGNHLSTVGHHLAIFHNCLQSSGSYERSVILLQLSSKYFAFFPTLWDQPIQHSRTDSIFSTWSWMPSKMSSGSCLTNSKRMRESSRSWKLLGLLWQRSMLSWIIWKLWPKLCLLMFIKRKSLPRLEKLWC